MFLLGHAAFIVQDALVPEGQRKDDDEGETTFFLFLTVGSTLPAFFKDSARQIDLQDIWN